MGVFHHEFRTSIDRLCDDYFVPGTQFVDLYIIGLVGKYSRTFEHTVNINSFPLLKSLWLSIWKNAIRRDYDRQEHIEQLVNQLLYYAYPKDDRDMEYFEETAYEEIYDRELKEFEFEGFNVEVIDIHKKTARLKKMANVWGEVTQYYSNEPSQNNDKRITIPQYVKSPTGMRYEVTELANGFFDNHTELEHVILPPSIKNVEWSFWNCPKLKDIEVSTHQPSIKTKDGVLFSGDGSTLIAYPNEHGTTYKVPYGVVEIGHFAFKSCNKLEVLYLPPTLKRISKNAFYRCEKLKRIECDFSKADIENKGFYGDYGNVEPEWLYDRQNYN